MQKSEELFLHTDKEQISEVRSQGNFHCYISVAPKVDTFLKSHIYHSFSRQISLNLLFDNFIAFGSVFLDILDYYIREVMLHIFNILVDTLPEKCRHCWSSF